MNGKKKYIKELKSYFIVYGKAEKDYIKQLKNQIDNRISYEEIIELYGEPKDLAESFLDESTTAIIKNNIKKKKIVLVIMVVSLLLIILIGCYVVSVLYNAEESYVTREETVIVEE